MRRRRTTIGSIASALILAVAFACTTQAQDEQFARARAETFFASLTTDPPKPLDFGRRSQVTYNSAEFKNGVLVIRDVIIARGFQDRITIEEVQVSRFDWSNPHHPAFGDTRYLRIRFPDQKDDPEQRKFREEMGLGETVLNTRVAFRYESAASTLQLDEAEVQSERMGAIAVSAQLTDLPPFTMKLIQHSFFSLIFMPMLIGEISVQRLKLTMKDEGGVRFILRDKARRESITEEAALSLLLVPIEPLKMAPFSAVRDTAVAVENFLRGRGTLTLEANPSTPVKLRRVEDILLRDSSPVAIARLLLDLRISASAQ